MIADRAHTRPAAAKAPAVTPAAKPAATHQQTHRALGNRAVGRLLAAGEGLPAPRVIDAGLRTVMEARFGQDFGSVRVYAGPAANALATAHRAKAFTFGEDIVFREGEYAPSTPAGRRSIAHELAHVVQQRRAGTSGESAVESDADDAARVFAADPNAPVPVRAARPVWVARQAEADDSLGVLDPVVDAIARAAASGALGGPLAPMAVAALRGFFAELRHRLSWTNLVELARSVEVGNFILGFEGGYLAGLFSPLTDLVGLLALAGKIPELFAKAAQAYDNRAGIVEEAEELGKSFVDWLGKVAKEISHLDAESIRELVDAAKRSGLNAASAAAEAGRTEAGAATKGAATSTESAGAADAAKQVEQAGAAKSARSAEADVAKRVEGAEGADAATRAEGSAAEAEGAQARKAEPTTEEKAFQDELDRAFADTPDTSRAAPRVGRGKPPAGVLPRELRGAPAAQRAEPVCEQRGGPSGDGGSDGARVHHCAGVGSDGVSGACVGTDGVDRLCVRPHRTCVDPRRLRATCRRGTAVAHRDPTTPSCRACTDVPRTQARDRHGRGDARGRRRRDRRHPSPACAARR